MKSIKKLLTLALASALLFTACSSGNTNQTSQEKKDDKKTEQAQTTDSKTLVVGATPSPKAIKNDKSAIIECKIPDDSQVLPMIPANGTLDNLIVTH